MIRWPTIVCLLAAACRDGSPTPAEPDPTQATLASVPSPTAAAPEFIAVVTSREAKVVTADFDGRIEQLLVRPSQRVKAGDVIARLDDKRLRDQIDTALATERARYSEVTAAEVHARAAATKLRSERMLAKAGASSMSAVSSARAEAESADAQTGAATGSYEAAKAQRVALEELLAKAELTAPIDGVVTMVKAQEGELAHQGTAIARVFNDKDLVIRFAVPHEQRKLIHVGQQVELSVEGVERPVAATVQTVSDELEPPVSFTVVEAQIADPRRAADELQVASSGRVRILDGGAKR